MHAHGGHMSESKCKAELEITSAADRSYKSFKHWQETAEGSCFSTCGCRRLFWPPALLYVDFGKRRWTKHFRQTDRSGEGVRAVLVNNRCCNLGQITAKEHLCTPDVELLDAGFHLCCCMWHHRHSCCQAVDTTLQCIYDEFWKFHLDLHFNNITSIWGLIKYYSFQLSSKQLSSCMLTTKQKRFRFCSSIWDCNSCIFKLKACLRQICTGDYTFTDFIGIQRNNQVL